MNKDHYKKCTCQDCAGHLYKVSKKITEKKGRKQKALFKEKC